MVASKASLFLRCWCRGPSHFLFLPHSRTQTTPENFSCSHNTFLLLLHYCCGIRWKLCVYNKESFPLFRRTPAQTVGSRLIYCDKFFFQHFLHSFLFLLSQWVVHLEKHLTKKIRIIFVNIYFVIRSGLRVALQHHTTTKAISENITKHFELRICHLIFI